MSPDVGLVLSIWPETYCHTLTELWMCNVPVIGTSLGAVGDRLRKCGGGWVVNPTYPSLKLTLMQLLNDRRQISCARESIESRSEFDLYPFVHSDNAKAKE